jgi:mannose-6-phosphate isomerase-like protein (cupin superfamily)
MEVMDIKSTLKVFNEADMPFAQGLAGAGHRRKQLAGSAEHPTERLSAALVTFEPGTHEHLHWHLVEVFYYVISGRAIMKDIEGKTYDVGPGSVVYASPGIASSHSWEITEKLQLIGIRATADPEKLIQFDVDPDTKESTLPLERLAARQVIDFKRSLY